MIPEYCDKGCYLVETSDGTEVVPVDCVGPEATLEDLRQFVCGKPDEDQEIKVHAGIIARMSAPGYLDATDWCHFEDIESAMEWIKDFYEVDPETGKEIE
jgi:hypothetical protein